MISKSVYFAIGTLLCLSATERLRAETASFPKDQPAFKVEMPSGWVATETETSLYVRPTAAGVPGHFFAFIELPPSEVSDATSAKKYVETYRTTELKNLNVEEKANIWPVMEESLPNGLKGWAAEANAFMKSKPGDLPQAIAFTAIAFSPDGDQYYLMVAFGRSADSTTNKDFLKKSILPPK
ncbi:MAG: hypothetical protein QOH88_2744 [Verrucomicrobiota bacterium]|jgi:hypothetical protein